MLKGRNLTAAGLLMVIMMGLKSQETLNMTLLRGDYESEYYYAFTEATRQMIYQNYMQAINLYNKCLEYNPTSSAIKYQLSIIYFKLGKIYEAKVLGKEACVIDPENRWYIIHMIKLYQTTNQIDTAILYNKMLIDLEPEDVENKLNLAVLYQIGNQNKKAIEIYNEIESSYGKSIQLYINKYKIYQNTGKIKIAEKELEEAHKMAPDDMNIIGLMAEHYRDIGDKTNAEKYYSMLIKENGNEGVAVFSYLQYLLRFKRFEKAYDFFTSSVNNKDIEKEQFFTFIMNEMVNMEKDKNYLAFLDTAVEYYVERNGNDIRIKGLYVDYQFKRSRFDRASEMLKKMLIGNEQNYRIWEQILYAENALNHSDSVIKYGEKTMESFDNEAIPYLYTGIAYQQQKNVEKAILLFEKGIALTDNKSIVLQYNIFLAEAYHEDGKKEKAFSYYEKALSIESDNILVLNNYAYYLALDNSNLEKAERMSKYTIEKEKKNCIYLDTYAWIMHQMKREAEAKKYIRKAMKYGGSIRNEIVSHYKIIMSK